MSDRQGRLQEVADKFVDAPAEDGEKMQIKVDKLYAAAYGENVRPIGLESLGIAAYARLLCAAATVDNGTQGDTFNRLYGAGPLEGPLVAARALDHTIHAIERDCPEADEAEIRAALGALVTLPGAGPDVNMRTFNPYLDYDDQFTPRSYLSWVASQPNDYNRHYELAMGLERNEYHRWIRGTERVVEYFSAEVRESGLTVLPEPTMHQSAKHYSFENAQHEIDGDISKRGCPVRASLLPVVWTWMVDEVLSSPEAYRAPTAALAL